MIEDSLSRRAHVWKYCEDVIPTEAEILEILQTAYPLVTSKQKAYAYKAHILGPNKARSRKLWNMCEGNKIRTDEEEFGDSDEAYRSNPGLYHILSAPYTIIYTPRIAPPNPFKNMEDWKDFPYIDFYPDLIQTIGKAEKYKWQFYHPERLKTDTDAPFEDIFNFVDNSQRNTV